MKFSVLISCYYRDNPNELQSALKSIWNDQSIKPAEIVIVKDGSLTTELDKVIDEFCSIAPVKIVPLEHNRGLGIALAHGVEACSYEYIARMDSDDIAFPDRFEKQVHFMEQHPEVDICGSAIDEFQFIPEQTVAKRILPENHKELLAFLKWRCPFNHMTVMYKKKAILDVGNYKDLRYYEDYWLWGRCFAAEKIGANLPQSLVHARVGNGMYARRRGWRIFRSEYKLEILLYQLHLLSAFELCRNILLRGISRLLPSFGLKILYNSFLRNK